jgi:DNA-directed RNA polymerase specialized sigma24 family protein
VTLTRPDLLEAADAELLAQARTGDSEAFGVLYERHVAAARRLAYQLAATPRMADDVVSEAFGRMLDVVARGGGPSTAVRPYVLTAVRQVSYDRGRGGRDQLQADAATLPDPDQLLVDPAFAGLETALVARAYQSLPERSRAVLWHIEIERDAPADIAPLLGLTRNGVAALGRRAADDLRQAYLQMHVSLITQPGCRPVTERLGAFDRRSLSARDAALVSEHLARCEGCQVVHRELADIMASVRGVVAPLVLGPAAPAYLADAGQRPAAVTAAPLSASAPAVPIARTGAAIAGGDGSDPGSGSLSPARTPASMPPYRETAPLLVPQSALLPGLGRTRPSRAHRRSLLRSPGRAPMSRRVAAVAAAGVVLAVTGAIALAVTLTGNDNTPASARRLPPAASRQAPVTPSPSLSPSPQPSPSPASPQAAPPPAAASTSLTASLSVSGHGQGIRVVFQVANTGSAASGPLTAVLALPAGASLSSVDAQQLSGGNGSAQGTAVPLFGGWSCQPTSGGATCTHAALSAGQQTQGMLFITVSGSGACGQPVRLTVTGGGATVAAAQTLGC